jgi:hypothetical protein
MYGMNQRPISIQEIEILHQMLGWLGKKRVARLPGVRTPRAERTVPRRKTSACNGASARPPSGAQIMSTEEFVRVHPAGKGGGVGGRSVPEKTVDLACPGCENKPAVHDRPMTGDGGVEELKRPLSLPGRCETLDDSGGSRRADVRQVE